MSRIAALLLLLLVTACAGGRTITPLRVPGAVSAPTERVAVKLVVRDGRKFEAKPRQANIPSLAPGDIEQADLRARALGRKRGPFGRARGDFLLPPEQSVAAVVEAHVADAVSKAGGAVVGEADPRFASAVALEVEVTRFWSWLRPGAFKVQTEFDVELVVRGALPGLEAGKTVVAHVELRKGAMTDSRWIGLLNDGLTKLDAALLEALTPAFTR